MNLDYEERYKRALERARALNDGKDVDIEAGTTTCEYIFPELKKNNNDERIRKSLISFLKSPFVHENITDEKVDPWIAWLEKQGEQKPIFNADDWYVSKVDGKIYNAKFIEKQDEQKPADKVKPMFHEGDWITNSDYTWKILEVKPLHYILQSQDGNIVDDTISYVDKEFNLWTIADAKDGDVLVNSEGYPFIFSGKYDEIHFGNPIAYCGVTCENKFKESSGIHWTSKNGVTPATKKQREFLFQKMKEAGYEWDAEKKELKKIENEIEIPFGAKDSELQEVTYYIPKGFHAEIDDDKVVIKKSV